MREDIVKRMDYIFKPRSVAVIGASHDVNKWGGRILDRALRADFQGKMYPVNPREKEIMNLAAYKDVRDIPGPVDLAVFTVPASQMPTLMKNCVEKGVRGGVIISAGFAETGEQGRALEEETVRIAREGHLRFVGPNGNGIWSSAVGLNLSPTEPRIPGPVGFISQSGSFGGTANRIAVSRGFGFSKFISIGNQADLSAADYLEYLGQDDDTKVIALYMEGFKNGPRFIEAAKHVVRQKPVLLYKGGSSIVGARATLSHTASIAGSDAVFDGVCRQAGIIRVEQLEHLFVMAEALFSQPIPRGNRIAVLGNGGQGVVSSDNLIKLGMEVPEFTQEDQQRLKSILPAHAPNPRNPVDLAGAFIDTPGEVRIIDMLASLPYIDAVFTSVPREMSYKKTEEEKSREIADAGYALGDIPHQYGKPIITLSWLPQKRMDVILKEVKIPVHSVIEDCVLSMSALVRYGEIRRKMN
ncbi:MAG: CoA-binding protein [Deltaproteobacteria bacterium]|nr:CoA-binding protein [Deltaproteobacteria bacterium]